MIKIQDVMVPTKGTGKYFNLLALNFPPNPTSVSFYWSVFEETQNGQTEEGTPTMGPGKLILEGNITMNQETYNNWGTDDEYVIDWALNELGFIKVTE